MVKLLLIKEKLNKFLEKYERFVVPVLKSLLTLAVLFSIRYYLGATGTAASPLFIVILALIAAALPAGAVSFMGALFTIAQLYTISLEAAAAALVLCMILFLAYLLYGVGYGAWMIVMTAALIFRIPILPVLIIAVAAEPRALIPAGFGYFLFYLMRTVKINSSVFQSGSGSSSGMMTKFMKLFEGVALNPRLYLYLLAGICTALAVFAFRRFRFNYARVIAPVTGAVLYLIMTFIGEYMLDIDSDPIYAVIAAIIGVIASLGVTCFFSMLDYSRAEYAQFEDDKYYYYVKAVPKMSVAEADPLIKKIKGRDQKRKQETAEETGAARTDGKD